ncbi:hypothetical protein CWI39_3471p0010 [Hamiltosporidium magnivora]|uniref:Uncharacterized protein n=1 Tax=Hamiltosporidium magnivora TaxID=148818 RepID=A0A4V2JTL0_9MICR|nr:hypothetical protein CWI39_3471p0010 [Hamiltosporidium magnivora]
MISFSIHKYPRNSSKIYLYIFGRLSSFKYTGIDSERVTHECSCDLRRNNTRQQDLLCSATPTEVKSVRSKYER